MLKEVKNEEEIKLFGKYKVDLIKYHQQYANKLGLQDQIVDQYNYDDAIRHIGENNYYQFLIINNNKEVGILEYQITKSDIDKKDIIYIKNIYIEESFRGMGLGKKVINELRKMQYRIELECWYGMPSNELYKSLGAKEIKTRYILEN